MIFILLRISYASLDSRAAVATELQAVSEKLEGNKQQPFDISKYIPRDIAPVKTEKPPSPPQTKPPENTHGQSQLPAAGFIVIADLVPPLPGQRRETTSIVSRQDTEISLGHDSLAKKRRITENSRYFLSLLFFPPLPPLFFPAPTKNRNDIGLIFLNSLPIPQSTPHPAAYAVCSHPLLIIHPPFPVTKIYVGEPRHHLLVSKWKRAAFTSKFPLPLSFHYFIHFPLFCFVFVCLLAS